MPRTPVLLDLDPTNLESMPCCAVKNPAHEGRRRKNCWLNANLKHGLRAKMLVVNGRPCGYIESIPGEYAWRGVEASGYLFIHCLWTFSQRDKGKGLAGSLLRACLDDAHRSGMSGVAVLTREGPWLAGPGVFLKNGFQVVDTALPDYQLLVRKLQPRAADPALKSDWPKKLEKFSKGLTIIRSDQCPHIAKFADEIASAAEKEYGIKAKIIELKTHRDAQSAPTPNAVFSVIYNGKVLADHQISRTRFRNIMRRLQQERTVVRRRTRRTGGS